MATNEITLHEALGAVDEMDARRIVAEINQNLAALKQVTGVDSIAESISILRSAIACVRDLEKVTEKPALESIGLVLAFKASHEALPAAQAKVTELETALDERDRKDLYKQARENGQSTPASEEHVLSGMSIPQLRSFIQHAPRVIPVTLKQPAAPTATTTLAAANADGKKYEDISPSARAQLKKDDPELFNALRADWEQRDRPAGITTLARTASERR